LEAEAGRPLFDRLSRQVTLTEAGQGLLPHAKAILSQLTDAQQFLNDYRETPGGVLRVGIIPTIAPYLLRPLLSACQKEHPSLSLSLVEDVTQNLVRATANGEIDLAIISSCRPNPGMVLQTCLEEPLLVALPEAHPLAQQRQVHWPQLRKHRMLLLHDSHCLSGQIRRWCATQKIRIREELTTLQLPSLLAMIAAGHGISLVPAMAVRQETGKGCVFLPFRSSPPTRDVNLLRNAARYQSKAAAAVAELIKELLGRGLGSSLVSGAA
jgi:LysR family hydrogen peroxide-inducible transcriptional activator